MTPEKIKFIYCTIFRFYTITFLSTERIDERADESTDCAVAERLQRKSKSIINKCLNQKFQYFCKVAKKKM